MSLNSMRKTMDVNFIFLAIFLLQILFLQATGEPTQDKQALLDFVQNIHHLRPLNWEWNSSACVSWIGVTCNPDKSGIIALRLPAVGLRGPIPFNTLSRLSAIQILSLRSNAISGTFPSDFSKLKNLTSLYLQSNRFSGSLPSNFLAWKNLSVLNLSNNAFNGSIPSSISNLTHLTALNLSNNSLSDEIPDLNLPSLQLLDISNNNLTGTVPQALQRFPSSAFSGNNLSPENSPPPVLPPNAQPTKNSSKLGESAILGIIIGGCVMGFVILSLLLILCYSNKEAENGVSATTQKEKNVKKSVSASQEKNNRLVFFEGINGAFDLDDLLRASAEVLGKGIGMTYKAALEDSTVLAVKRLKELGVTRREFEQQMEVVGSIRHENVAPLRAYYYSKEEKLMVYDYYNQGSVSVMLHSKRGEGRTPLDWETRVRIAIGAARGIAYIHTQTGGKLVHGNIKASNIFLNSQQHGCVSDLGLATLINQVILPNAKIPGYRAPEVTNTRKLSQASDVYSYGVLLLELLTGKSPVNSTGGDEVLHLVRWVNSVIREEWTAEVFDTELLRYPNIEEEMVELLQIGMACAARVVEQRPKMTDVVKMVEDIQRINTGNRPSTD
ncbi:hypothetical protein LguiB_003745 [Lonicera macranthoides]